MGAAVSGIPINLFSKALSTRPYIVFIKASSKPQALNPSLQSLALG